LFFIEERPGWMVNRFRNPVQRPAPGQVAGAGVRSKIGLGEPRGAKPRIGMALAGDGPLGAIGAIGEIGALCPL